MDSAVQSAIVAAALPDDATVQHWFDAVCTTYQALSQHDWNSFTTALNDQATGAGINTQIVQQFVQQMSDNDSSPLDTIGRLVDLGSQLPALYQQFTATAATTSQTTPSSGYDQDAWHAFLAQNGPYWNGDNAAWDQFRTWFLYQATQQGLGDPANAFLSYVEGQDKVAAFAQYGIQIAGSSTGAASTAQTPAPDASTFPDTKPGDSGDWVAYLDTMLTRNGF